MHHDSRLETYPVFSLSLERPETRFKTVDEITGYLIEKIEADKIAHLISVFDPYSYISSLEQGYIGDDILATRSIVFCFGITLPSPEVMAERPRSIGICELHNGFFITFMEVPMPVANTTIEGWVRSLATHR
ncbi:MAG TPA: hypothetical protein ENJ24_04905 [Gammaproteobacteria bacterium]|nr:hypothetical protein [Gammaproteobacteria bacterium]